MIKILVPGLLLLFNLHASAQNIDLRLLNSINGPAAPADGFWRGVSKSDYFAISAVPITLLVTGLARHDRDLEIKGIETGGAIFLAEGGTMLLKGLTHRERPYLAHPDLIYGKSNSTDYSFPSGHTSTAFAMATSLSLAYPKWYVIAPSFMYASAVSYSRMYLGVHYPSDVFAGAVLGSASAYLTFKLQKLLDRKPVNKKPLP